MDPGAHAMSDEQTADALEHGIGQTRAELALTVNALEDKLSTRHLVEKGLDMINDSIGGAEGINQGISRGLTAVRSNPVPFALIAIGAAWLFASNTGIVDRLAQDERVRAAGRRAGAMASDLGNRAGEMASDLGNRAGGYASDMAQRVGLTGNGSAGAGGWVHQATDMAEETMQSARDSTNTLWDAVERNPLIVGGLGVFAGAILAILMPATRTEDQLLGGIREAFWDRAEQAGQQAAVAARKIAENAADIAADTAAQVARNAGAGRA
jgi:hypothetical protein